MGEKGLESGSSAGSGSPGGGGSPGASLNPGGTHGSGGGGSSQGVSNPGLQSEAVPGSPDHNGGLSNGMIPPGTPDLTGHALEGA
jgi:hypothetical protein